jgi:hypothetical protein
MRADSLDFARIEGRSSWTRIRRMSCCNSSAPRGDGDDMLFIYTVVSKRHFVCWHLFEQHKISSKLRHTSKKAKSMQSLAEKRKVNDVLKL